MTFPCECTPRAYMSRGMLESLLKVGLIRYADNRGVVVDERVPAGHVFFDAPRDEPKKTRRRR